MDQETKRHLKYFAECLKEALKPKTGWGRNELRSLIDTILIEYFVGEADLAVEEEGRLEVKPSGGDRPEGPKPNLSLGSQSERDLPPLSTTPHLKAGACD